MNSAPRARVLLRVILSRRSYPTSSSQRIHGLTRHCYIRDPNNLLRLNSSCCPPDSQACSSCDDTRDPPSHLFINAASLVEMVVCWTSSKLYGLPARSVERRAPASRPLLRLVLPPFYCTLGADRAHVIADFESLWRARGLRLHGELCTAQLTKRRSTLSHEAGHAGVRVNCESWGSSCD